MFLQTNIKQILAHNQACYLQRYDSINSHAGCVNVVKLHRDSSNNRLLLFSGSDDRHIGVSSIEPEINSVRIDLAAKHRGNITALKTLKSSEATTIISAANKGTVCTTNLE